MGSPSDTQFCDLSPVPAQVRETIGSILSFFLEEAFLFLPAVPAFPPILPKTLLPFLVVPHHSTQTGRIRPYVGMPCLAFASMTE